jgi:hypothetical protein
MILLWIKKMKIDLIIYNKKVKKLLDLLSILAKDLQYWSCRILPSLFVFQD